MMNVWILLDFPKISKMKILKQLYSTFSKWLEYQWKNAISMQYTDSVTPGGNCEGL